MLEKTASDGEDGVEDLDLWKAALNRFLGEERLTNPNAFLPKRLFKLDVRSECLDDSPCILVGVVDAVPVAEFRRRDDVRPVEFLVAVSVEDLDMLSDEPSSL